MWKIHSAWPQSAFILRNWAEKEDEGKRHANFKCWEYRCLKPLKSRQRRIATTLTKMPNNLKINFFESICILPQISTGTLYFYHNFISPEPVSICNVVFSVSCIQYIYEFSVCCLWQEHEYFFFFIDAGFKKLVFVLCIH